MVRKGSRPPLRCSQLAARAAELAITRARSAGVSSRKSPEKKERNSSGVWQTARVLWPTPRWSKPMMS
ncbi:hypothetical protein [Streptomyces sp. NRRL S-495]|uniref:hypothetical protein n=1 Tax=Streptomyces sp. NRRL S-495 TaxID=1609133 RepID=UPI002570783D|nr:hypothetical protein [Streptomyces sp. NRRL S-495]